MKVIKIKDQHRRDFHAIYECEHCGHTKESYGYDDSYFHNVVIPEMICDECGKKAESGYRPLTTKYSDDEVV